MSTQHQPRGGAAPHGDGHTVDLAPPQTAGGTRHFRMRTGDTVIEITWGADTAPAAAPAAPVAEAAPVRPATVVSRAHGLLTGGPDPADPADPVDAGQLAIRAPMVGTFYHAPDAGARPFVGVGDVVQPGQTVGILEVMKMMNPVTADVAGRVVAMVVPDAHPVEYDQPLITVEPLGHG